MFPDVRAAVTNSGIRLRCTFGVRLVQRAAPTAVNHASGGHNGRADHPRDDPDVPSAGQPIRWRSRSLDADQLLASDVLPVLREGRYRDDVLATWPQRWQSSTNGLGGWPTTWETPIRPSVPPARDAPWSRYRQRRTGGEMLAGMSHQAVPPLAGVGDRFGTSCQGQRQAGGRAGTGVGVGRDGSTWARAQVNDARG